jgi:hypothetical protein
MVDWYRLDGKTPVKVDNVLEAFISPQDRVLKQETVGDAFVSTVFLALDHRWEEDEPPVLFETMIFGGEHDQYQDRYCTWDGAMEGHQKAVNLVKTKLLNGTEEDQQG